MVCVNFAIETGQCRRWNQRPSECTAYHCESKSGEQGLKSWNQRAHRWHQLECDVAQMAMLEFGYNHHEISQQLDWITNPPTFNNSSIDLDKVWSHYKQREFDYYTQCSLWASALSKERLMEFYDRP